MSKLEQSIVLITGGDSGLGKELALKALQHGAATVVIWGRNKERLNKTAQEFCEKNLDVKAYLVDIGEPNQVLTAARQVMEEVGIPTIIINNAAMAAVKDFTVHSRLEIGQIMQVNAIGPMLLTKAFLPSFFERGSGHIVNIASAAGLTPTPRMSVYAASKWALIGWSESLRIELEEMKSGIHVTTVTPGFINTRMFERAKAPFLTWILKADCLAEAIIRAVKRNKAILRSPFTIHLLPVFRGLLPTRVYDTLVGKGFGVYSSLRRIK